MYICQKINDFDTFWDTLFESIELRAAKETNPNTKTANSSKIAVNAKKTNSVKNLKNKS